MSAILMRYWFWSSRMLSRTRTLGMMTPISAARVCRHALDSLQQIAAAFRIGQADQADAQFEFHRIDHQVVLDALLRSPRGLSLFFVLGGWALLSRRKSVMARPTQAAPTKSSGIRGRSVKTSMPRNPPATANACGRRKSCRRNSLGQIARLIAAGDQHAGGQRNQEGGHLGDQPVADGRAW